MRPSEAGMRQGPKGQKVLLRLLRLDPRAKMSVRRDPKVPLGSRLTRLLDFSRAGPFCKYQVLALSILFSKFKTKAF